MPQSSKHSRITVRLQFGFHDASNVLETTQAQETWETPTREIHLGLGNPQNLALRNCSNLEDVNARDMVCVDAVLAIRSPLGRVGDGRNSLGALAPPGQLYPHRPNKFWRSPDYGKDPAAPVLAPSHPLQHPGGVAQKEVGASGGPSFMCQDADHTANEHKEHGVVVAAVTESVLADKRAPPK